MAKTIRIPDEVRAVLARSKIIPEGEEFTLSLPNKLDRNLYGGVAKIIKAAGGKWNRGRATHVFQDDPREVLGMALESGSIENKQQVQQFFPTPEALAEEVIAAASIGVGMKVLEPSAGRGALIDAALKAGAAWVVGVELHNDQFKHLTKKAVGSWDPRRVTLIPGDFKSLKPDGEMLFDAVVMNPPFSEGQEVEHVMHAYGFLKPGGKLVAIMSSAVTFRSNGKYGAWLDFIEKTSMTLRENPQGSFKESGTAIDTVMVILEKS